jgi:hypothetical protein
MTPAAIALLQQAADCKLELGFEPPSTLTVEPARLCPPDLVPVLKSHKPELLALLRLPFCMVYSRTLGETVFFCEDEDTKASLVEAGASHWSIYTKRELRQLIAQNGIAPIPAEELRKFHEIKRTFDVRLTK